VTKREEVLFFSFPLMLHLNPKERIIFIKRRHWIVLLGASLIVFFAFLVLISGLLAISSASVNIPPYYRRILVFVFSSFLLFLWLFFFIDFTDYWLDIWILTEKKVMVVEQKGLFHRVVSEFPIERIQDITVDTNGVLQTFLKYGNLQIQTASEKRKFIFKQIPRPYQTKNAILKLLDKRIAKI